LESYREYGTHKKSWKKLTGEEFLFTRHALGLSPELIGKIREVVDGRGLNKGNLPIKWATLGSAASDLKGNARVRPIWGPELHKQAEALFGRLDSLGGSNTSTQKT
jgi:hypothetical protein